MCFTLRYISLRYVLFSNDLLSRSINPSLCIFRSTILKNVYTGNSWGDLSSNTANKTGPIIADTWWTPHQDNLSITCSFDSAAPNKSQQWRRWDGLIRDCLGKRFPKSLSSQDRMLMSKVQERIGACGAMKVDWNNDEPCARGLSESSLLDLTLSFL